MSKLIPKYQNAWGTLNYSAPQDNTKVAPIMGISRSNLYLQGDFLYTPEHYTINNGIITKVSETKKVNLIPLEITSPEFDILLGGPLFKNVGKYAADKAGFFVRKPNSFTRGIGSKTGLRDLYESGVVRGNPVGTEMSAKSFSKHTKFNRNHFNDIMNDSGVKNAAIKYNNRELTKEEFDAIKEASKKYPIDNDTFFRQYRPLEDYDSYDDYLEQIASDRKTLANATSLDYGGLPLAYFYDDGRNPLTAGHKYAASNYGVRINNINNYPHRIFPGHLHQSLDNAISLNNKDVEVFKKLKLGPFNFTRRINKKNINKEL